jgi:hypothetical protein
MIEIFARRFTGASFGRNRASERPALNTKPIILRLCERSVLARANEELRMREMLARRFSGASFGRNRASERPTLSRKPNIISSLRRKIKNGH